MAHKNISSVARSATLHCLTGCSVGEILGLIAGTILGLSNHGTIFLAVALSFLFGFSLSTLPLIKTGLNFRTALSVVIAADTLSIASMEIVDNLVMAIIPGAMAAGLVNPLYWTSMSVSLFAAFLAAYPVNLWLLKHGRGHALVHKYFEGHEHNSGEHHHA